MVLLNQLSHVIVPLLTLTGHLVTQQFLNTLHVLLALLLLLPLHYLFVEELNVLEHSFHRTIGKVLLQIVVLVFHTLQLCLQGYQATILFYMVL